MLNKSILAILTVLSFILLPYAVFAIVTCSPCLIDGCVCQTTECSKGIFNVFTISDCSGVPYVRDTFTNGVKTWYPQNAIDYYILILCDDGTTMSACTPQTALLKGQPTITTSITTTTTPRTTTTTFTGTETATEETEATYTTEEQPSGGGFNFLWILLIFIIIGVGFYFLKMRKKQKLSYEQVYKKWSR